MGSHFVFLVFLGLQGEDQGEELFASIDGWGSGCHERFLTIEAPGDRDDIETDLVTGFDVTDFIADVEYLGEFEAFILEGIPEGLRFIEEFA